MPIERHRLAWFEEPVYGTDANCWGRCANAPAPPISTGQNEDHEFRYCELIAGEAIDVSQPNVVYCGGNTKGRKIASLAEAFDLDIAGGAGFPPTTHTSTPPCRTGGTSNITS